MEEEQVREYCSKMNTHKSMGLDRIHPRLLRQMTEVIERTLIIFE